MIRRILEVEHLVGKHRIRVRKHPEELYKLQIDRGDEVLFSGSEFGKFVDDLVALRKGT